MSADLFADWKKEEETFSDSRGGGGFDSAGAGVSSSSGAGVYASPYAGAAASDAYDGSSTDDFEFETVGDDAQGPGQEQDKPLFELREHGLKVSRRKGFTLSCMGAGNGVLAMGSQEGLLLRCTTEATDSSGTVEEIMIEPRVAMSNVFIDPTGAHVLISMENGSNFYLHTGSTRPKKIMKAQALQFTSVAWDRQSGSPEASEPVLIGMDSGAVFEAEFDGGKEKSFKKVYQISNQGPIAGVAFEHWKLPSGDLRYYVMLTTSASGKRPTRMFQFIGGGPGGLEAMFSEYTSPDKLRFQELPGEVTTAELRFYAKQERERAKGFGVLTGEGVYHGEFVFGLSSTMENVATGTGLLAYPGKPEKASGSRGAWTPPISMAVTQYHVILLYARHVQVVSKLSGVVVMEETFDSRVGNVHGITVDDTFNTVWIHSNRRILEVVIADEDRDVWKLFLSKAVMGNGDDRDFEQALGVCRNGWERQRVLTAQADKLFDKGEYDRAAVIYAKTTRSFEEVALKFLEKETRDSLLLFLLQKLKSLGGDEKTQKTVLCSWIVELFLDKFNVLKGSAQDVDAHANLLFEFKQFLQDQKTHLDPATTFNLISSHGRPDELVFYATLIEDYEKVITYHVDRGEYGAAIELLRSVETSKVEELWYKYSPELIIHKPNEVYEAWLEAATLNPTRLIPSIVRHVHQKSGGGSDPASNTTKSRSVLDMAIRFLKFAIKQGNRDPTIHNYLLFLLAKHPDERLLISFLRKKHNGKHLFDIAFALRLCTQNEKNRACIYIYSAMGLYQDAVEKALQVDVKIAKEMASMPEDDETRKKLWTLIAKHTIDAGGEIKDAMNILKESGLLKIEDILPFFPDFVLINDFKKEICESLEVYNDRIEQLKEEMQDYTQSAELIRADMQKLRKRCAVVSGNQRCELTGQNILGKEFYLFPCSHAFHAGALRQEMQKHLNSFQRQTVKQLIQKLNELSTEMPASTNFFQRPLSAFPFLNLSSSEKEVMTPGAEGISVAATAKAKNAAKVQSIAQEREMVQQKLDEIIASECIFCGEVMIKSIHTPFITPEDEANEGSEWAI
ncbi:Vacuolar protein sorting-associated protein 18 [Phytophthora fragariae]|uniref:Vacuolar protein sorting-associated protein 18 n=1 Tax=Phytophthora fragariae TaxID=53985 RepID=A0A6A3WTI5_9STRA|nr:Vacuolar protein sorting-associated protein 18 [Phytophthora fragariae]KAE8928838.1 Vacuolar protein sorting-associated protein 18 [Phytophthora fragariae]KAE8989610.1 Vacuolar protein sorting-associated protein 18 [Phytophthora fragariae]KAE9090604.1 Vacuolar protein sorting-associated protein 18 [Phytophthora fragariae]KAE9090697.1 Vacuolar protein sorting-associated protein 18 [Phytophthora fragariae]